MLNAKDFHIKYLSEMGQPPNEEEWLAYLDELDAQAEARKDWMADHLELWNRTEKEAPE